MTENPVPETSDRLTKVSITMRVPESNHREPVISHLVSDFGLVVNITAAVLGENQGDGWFNLELEGAAEKIKSGLVYLQERNLEVWDKTNDTDGGW
jgi:ABC-type methionine transport system ATPase subunit